MPLLIYMAVDHLSHQEPGTSAESNLVSCTAQEVRNRESYLIVYVFTSHDRDEKSLKLACN